MTDRDRHADTVIRNHTLFSMASGAIPVALADLAAVSAVQLDMVRNLCEVYDADFSTKRGKALVTSITTAALARAGAASLVKLIPVAGTLVGSVTGGVLAGASSYALGQVFKTHLSAGGTFLDLDVERFRRLYREQFEKGKGIVKEWKEQTGEPSGFDFDNVTRTKNHKPQRDTNPAPSATAEPEGDHSLSDAAEEMIAPVVQADTISSKLEELAALRAKGLISDDDFERTKQRLLAGI